MESNIKTIIHETDSHGTFSEFLYQVKEPSYAVLAPHGGQVEPNTDTEAVLIVQQLEDAVVWGTRGITDDTYENAFNQWHTTSRTDPLHEFPLYQSLTTQSFSGACSLHAMGDDGIIVGGGAPEDNRESLCETLERYFPSTDVRLGREGERRAGRKPSNFVNNLDAENSIHIEQSLDIATTNPHRLSCAIAEWYNTSR